MPALSELSHRSDDSPISELMARALASTRLISLAAGFVDSATLPVEATRDAALALLSDENEGRRALQYGTTQGDLRLREELAKRLLEEEGLSSLDTTELVERIVITSGSQQLLYLIAEALLDPGDIVLVESPTYFVFLGVLRTRGARVIGVATDEDGMRLDSLRDTLAQLEREGDLERVKLIYTVSEHSNPTGISLAKERRGSLLEIAREWSKSNKVYVLEDAAYRGLVYDGAEPPSLWAHDVAGDCLILARTFSKTFSPGLKIGYGVLPGALLGPVRRIKGSHDFGSAHFNQQLLERILTTGAYERHVRILVDRYRQKRDVMLEALDEEFREFRGEVSWTRPRGGLYVWLTLPRDMDTGRDGTYFNRCVSEGVLYVPGEYAFGAEPVAPPRHYIRLSFGVSEPAGLRDGIRRMASALRAELRRERLRSSGTAQSTIPAGHI
jgi:2-aminoadipate transaminase